MRRNLIAGLSLAVVIVGIIAGPAHTARLLDQPYVKEQCRANLSSVWCTGERLLSIMVGVGLAVFFAVIVLVVCKEEQDGKVRKIVWDCAKQINALGTELRALGQFVG